MVKQDQDIFTQGQEEMNSLAPGVVTTTKWPMTNYILFFWPVVKCV